MSNEKKTQSNLLTHCNTFGCYNSNTQIYTQNWPLYVRLKCQAGGNRIRSDLRSGPTKKKKPDHWQWYIQSTTPGPATWTASCSSSPMTIRLLYSFLTFPFIHFFNLKYITLLYVYTRKYISSFIIISLAALCTKSRPRLCVSIS